MNEDAGKRYEAADKKLNAIFQAVTKMYQGNADFLKKLRTAETAWMAYRDAQVKMVYPSTEPFFYGSAHPMCKADLLSNLTNTPTEQLEQMLNPDKPRADVAEQFRKSEVTLNSVHKMVLKIYETKFLPVMQKASVNWLSFRDADSAAAAALAKPAQKEAAATATKAALNKLRIKELRQWIEGSSGDVCAGSIPSR